MISVQEDATIPAFFLQWMSDSFLFSIFVHRSSRKSILTASFCTITRKLIFSSDMEWKIVNKTTDKHYRRYSRILYLLPIQILGHTHAIILCSPFSVLI